MYFIMLVPIAPREIVYEIREIIAAITRHRESGRAREIRKLYVISQMRPENSEATSGVINQFPIRGERRSLFFRQRKLSSAHSPLANT